MENTFLAIAVVAVVEFLRRVQARDWFAAITIVVAAIIGGLAGWQHVQGLADVWTGIVLGLGSSGIITIASRVTGYSLTNKE